MPASIRYHSPSRLLRCVCGPDLPGQCPGQSSCPHASDGEDAPAPRACGDIASLEYVEVSDAGLDLIEWKEAGDATTYSAGGDTPIPDAVRVYLAQKVAPGLVAPVKEG